MFHKSIDSKTYVQNWNLKLEKECVCEREREKRERERERERRGEYENREGKEKSLKNRCAKIVCLQ